MTKNDEHHDLVYIVKELLIKWANLSGQDKCWHHEDILTKLCEVFEIPILEKPVLPPRCEFEKGCKDYQDKIYG